jgi:DNA-binding winged helix-turn-helix (wHTH) protein
MVQQVRRGADDVRPADVEPTGEVIGVPEGARLRSEQLRRLVEQTERLTRTRTTLEERLVDVQRNVERLVRAAPGAKRAVAPTSWAIPGAVVVDPAASPDGELERAAADGNGAAAAWQSDQRLSLGPLEVLPMRQTVVNGAHSFRLTPTEWQLLAYLMAHPGEVLTRAELATGAWGAGFASRASEVEVYISRLRKKLEWDGGRLIETVRGSGYRLTEAPQVTVPDEAV